jgi:peptidyl-tRNA hydrolase, PTH1 family
MPIKLIVGLQNPGSSYAKTRHNAGGWFAEQLVSYWDGSFKLDKKLQGSLADIVINDHACKVLIPSTYMNHSGRPVRAVKEYYQIKPEEILVAHDELDLDVGRVKVKSGGGHGGHNGLRDMIALLGSNQFNRLRIGIGHPGHKDMVTDFVLGKPSGSERDAILSAIEKSIDVMPTLISGDIANAMNQLNG